MREFPGCGAGVGNQVENGIHPEFSTYLESLERLRQPELPGQSNRAERSPEGFLQQALRRVLFECSAEYSKHTHVSKLRE